MDNTHIHLPGHQAHPIQPVPKTGDEEEDLGRREEARSLLTCTVLKRFMKGQTIKQLDLIFLQSSSCMKTTFKYYNPPVKMLLSQVNLLEFR